MEKEDNRDVTGEKRNKEGGRNYYPGQIGEVRRAEEQRRAVIWQKRGWKALKGRFAGEGGRTCWLGRLSAHMASSCWVVLWPVPYPDVRSVPRPGSG